MYHDSWTRKEIYSVDGSTVNGPIVQQFKKSATVTCSASLSNSNMEKTFTIIPKSEFDLSFHLGSHFDPKWPLKLLFTYYFLAIDIQLAALDPTYRPGIDPQFLTVNLGTDVDMDKLDIKILDKDGKPLNIGDPEIKQVGEVDGVPQYVLTYEGKILKSIRSSCDNAMWQWFYCDMWVNFQFLNF